MYCASGTLYLQGISALGCQTECSICSVVAGQLFKFYSGIGLAERGCRGKFQVILVVLESFMKY